MTGEPPEVTVAVKVTELLGEVVKEGLRLEEIVVLVLAAAATVMVTVQPPETLPAGSPVKTSMA